MSFLEIMNTQSYSPTGGLLIISQPGRGVSWVSPGKTSKQLDENNIIIIPGFKRQRKCEMIPPKDHHAVGRWNQPSEDREQQLVQSTTQQVCHISADVHENWLNTPAKDEIEYTPTGPKFKAKYTPEQRFAKALHEHFAYICEQAGILPNRCSYTWNPTTSSK